jgi:hypothetical protein
MTHEDWSSDNKPISISSDEEFYYVLSTLGNVYIFDTDYTFVLSFTARSGNKIHANATNAGIIYIVSDTIYAYTRTGIFLNYLKLPDNFPTINQMIMFAKENYILTPFSLTKIIDFIDIQSVKTDYYNLSSWNWNSIYIQQDEPVTAFVMNDSFKKIHDNIKLLYSDIDAKFVITVDEYSTFVRHSVSALNVGDVSLSAYYHPLGINEIVAYDNINKLFNNVYLQLTDLQELLEVRYYRVNGDFICWNWKGQRIDRPHNITVGNRPFSWYELRSNTVNTNIYLSGGVSWNQLNTCSENSNAKITWTWEMVTCCGRSPITWEQLTCDKLNSATWESLENNCTKIPKKYFDECISVC